MSEPERGSPRGTSDGSFLPEAVLIVMLALVPVAHLRFIPVAGTAAAGADLVVGGAVVVAGVLLLVRDRPSLRADRDLPFVLLLAFGAYVALSGLWGHHSSYALAKGVGYGGLAAAAWLLTRSRLDWGRAVDAWLVGTGIALAFTFTVAVLGAVAYWFLPGALPWLEMARERLVYRAGAVHGLGFPRLRGPFLHPNLLGEYLVVSGALLWGRWPRLRAARPGTARALAAGVALGLVLAVPSAWVAAGVLLAGWGWLALRAPREGAGGAVLGLGALLGGTAVAAATTIGLLFHFWLDIGPVGILVEGARPHIWASSLDAVLHAPILGVGAAPFLAETFGVLGGTTGLWEAHSVYLGVLGQFGLVGALLLGGGVGLLVLAAARRAGPARGPWIRARTAVLAALLAVAIHGIFSGSEDFRHAWLLLGLVGIVARGPEVEDTE